MGKQKNEIVRKITHNVKKILDKLSITRKVAKVVRYISTFKNNHCLIVLAIVLLTDVTL